MQVYPWPRTGQYWQDAEIQKWFTVLGHFKLPKTGVWVAESGRHHELINVCEELAKVNGTLAILVSPDSETMLDNNGNKIGVETFKQCKNDQFWTNCYTEYSRILQRYKGKITIGLIHYDMEGYKIPDRQRDEEVLSRMYFWEHITRNILIGDFQESPIQGFWYGLGWRVPKVNATGNLTGRYVWDRVPDTRKFDSSFINMYWQIKQTVACYDETYKLSAPNTLLLQWCGILKDPATGKDRPSKVSDDKDGSHQRYWANLAKGDRLPIIVYGSNRGMGITDEIADAVFYRDLGHHLWGLTDVSPMDLATKVGVVELNTLTKPVKPRVK